MKQCFKCARQLPLSEFYKHPKMADGHLGKCKDCAKTDVRENHRARFEYYQEYEAVRAKTPKRKLLNKRITDEDRANWPERYKARYTLTNAIRDGRIEKPCTCSRCREEFPLRRIHAHHTDYSKPLDVLWLCVRCHKLEHLEHPLVPENKS